MARSPAVVSEALKKVPPFPPVASRLLQLLSHTEVEIGEVAELISNDATFTARVLQRANSAKMAQLSPVTSLKQAVALLGIDPTRNIVLLQATTAYGQGALKAEELRRCWEHTVATAILAEEIAIACSAFTQTAFTAGIMHDIGRLGLLVAYPADYERIIRHAAEHCLDLLDFEHEEFGLDHAEAGRLLAEQWKLPPDMCIVAGRHHDPCEGTELTLLRIVHVACRLADALGYEVVKPEIEVDLDIVLAELPERARVKLGDTRRLRALVDERICEYTNARNPPQPPEESLALLGSTIALDPPAETTSAAEPELAATPQEKGSQKGRELLIAAVLVAIALATILLWSLR